MYSVQKQIRERRSVRTFDERPLSEHDMESIRAFLPGIQNPYGLPVEFRFLSAKERSLSCPVVTGCDLYIGGKMPQTPYCNEAFGYSFEMLVLFAQSLGIGTVWVGGTMDRAAFERAMELRDGEVMPCVTPLGYPAQKMSLRESLMRKGIRADSRAEFGTLFFDSSFDAPLTEARAGALLPLLEAVQLGPSAVNRQPWRIVVQDGAAHFYLKRAKGFSSGIIDMQKIDLGIAMCHFELTAKECGMKTAFHLSDPGMKTPDGVEYIASYKLL